MDLVREDQSLFNCLIVRGFPIIFKIIEIIYSHVGTTLYKADLPDRSVFIGFILGNQGCTESHRVRARTVCLPDFTLIAPVKAGWSDMF